MTARETGGVVALRMYEAVPGAARAWRALLARIVERAGVEAEVIEHRAPAPIAELWARPDLACAFMCGWPFSRAPGMQPIAAPVPSPPRYAGEPRYCSEFLVREESGWRTLEETFGHRFGWMSRDSHSGFNAPRAHLAKFVGPGRPRLFSEVRGPLGAPMGALEALRRGDVDLVALDGFWLDLVRRHEPSRLAGVRCVATTDWSPIPPLVASPGAAPRTVESLRAALTSAHEIPGLEPLLADVLVARFVAMPVQAYAALGTLEAFAASRGYAEIR